MSIHMNAIAALPGTLRDETILAIYLGEERNLAAFELGWQSLSDLHSKAARAMEGLSSPCDALGHYLHFCVVYLERNIEGSGMLSTN